MRSILWCALALSGCAGVLDGEDDDSTGSAVQALNGDSWWSVDDNAYGGNGAYYNGVAIQPNQMVWVVGSRVETPATGENTWIVRNALAGKDFTLNSTYKLATNRSSWASQVAADANGRVFVIGTALDANFHQHWITRMSANGGAAWTTVDDYTVAGKDTESRGLAIDETTGTIVVTGILWTDGILGSQLKTRISTNHGTSWTEVDSLAGTAHEMTGGYGACFVDGSFYTTGLKAISHPTADFIVRGSTTGQTWAMDEDATLGPLTSSGIGCGGVAGGPLYVAGYYKGSGGDYHWLVQRSDDHGATFTNVDDISAQPYTYANAVRPGPSGSVVVAGERSSKWVVRRSTNGTTFFDSDVGGVPNQEAAAMGYKWSTQWNMGFAVGYINDATGVPHAIVRRTP